LARGLGRLGKLPDSLKKAVYHGRKNGKKKKLGGFKRVRGGQQKEKNGERTLLMVVVHALQNLREL